MGKPETPVTPSKRGDREEDEESEQLNDVLQSMPDVPEEDDVAHLRPEIKDVTPKSSLFNPTPSAEQRF